MTIQLINHYLLIPQAISKNIWSQKTPLSKPSLTSADTLPSPPPTTTEVIAAVFQEKPDIMLPVKSKPRTKADIIRFSDAEDDDHDSDDSESDESIDISDIKSKVKFLPATIEGLCERFHTLWTEFTRLGKHEQRN